MSADRRLLRTVLLAATLVVAGLAAPATVAAAGRPPAPKPTIVLVHGAWADASSWAPVTTRLQQRGYTVLGLQGGGDPSALFDSVAYPGAGAGDVDLYVKNAVFPGVFAADLPAATAAQLAAAQRPIALSALLEPSGPPAWKSLPSWYLLGTEDQILPPALQLTMARRAHSRITRTPTSHLPMLSRPGVVTDVIVAATR
jgi:pimeloyl-ACP methyl ester carboxylesterase